MPISCSDRDVASVLVQKVYVFLISNKTLTKRGVAPVSASERGVAAVSAENRGVIYSERSLCQSQ